MNGALAGLVILAVGDSHMVYMGPPLHEALQQHGATVNTYGMCGAMATDWLSRGIMQCSVERHETGPATLRNQAMPNWLLPDLIAKDRPNLVVIELGDNMAGYGTLPTLPRDFITAQVNQFLAPIKARNLPCVWIGPPWGNDTTAYHKTPGRLKELSQFLAQAVAPCTYIDTMSLAQPGEWPTVDGEHLTQPAYHKWAQTLSGQIVRLKGNLH